MATTINSYSVGLGMDASGYIDGAKISRSETRQLIKDIEGARTPTEQYAREQDRLTDALNKGAISQSTYNRILEKKSDLLKGATTSLQSMSREMSGVILQYAGMSAAFVGAKNSLSLAATAETNKVALEVLTGSAEKAKMLFDGFIELDRSSPLSRQDFSKASQTLVGYGFAASSTLPVLKQLSEISVGNADRFQSLSLAFGQVTATGRLMGQEVLQMVNAGFNPLQEISRTTGRSMVDLKRDMEAGAISSGMVEDALRSATSEGGRFYEMNVKLAGTAAGQYAKMQSDVQLLATEIGTNLMPAAKAFLDLLKAGSDGHGGGGFLSTIATAFSTGAEGLFALGSDAITNLDGNSYGTKFSDLRERLDYAKMESQIKKEYVHVNTKEENARIQKNIAERENEKRATQEKQLAAEKLAQTESDEREKVLMDDLKRIEDEDALHAKKMKNLNELSLREANKFFEDQKRKDEARRKEVAKGPGSGMEVGSAEAAKYMADQVNAAIGDSVVPDKGSPTQEQLVQEAGRQSIILEEANRKQDENTKKLDELIEIQRGNGWRRI